MPAWTPGERRGALIVALLLALGAARDLWRAEHPELTPAPPPSAAGALEAGGGPNPEGSGIAAQPEPGRLLDLNRAGPAELDALPGIGPVLAGRILEHRNRYGPFQEPEDLLAVPGIGPRLFERLRPLVRVGASPTGDSTAGAAAGPGGGHVPGRPSGP
jgi:competence protein ComEA